MRVRIVGPGRAGLSFSKAFTRIGWQVLEHLGRYDDLTNAAEGVDLVLKRPLGIWILRFFRAGYEGA